MTSQPHFLDKTIAQLLSNGQQVELFHTIKELPWIKSEIDQYKKHIDQWNPTVEELKSELQIIQMTTETYRQAIMYWCEMDHTIEPSTRSNIVTTIQAMMLLLCKQEHVESLVSQ